MKRSCRLCEDGCKLLLQHLVCSLEVIKLVKIYVFLLQTAKSEIKKDRVKHVLLPTKNKTCLSGLDYRHNSGSEGNDLDSHHCGPGSIPRTNT